MRPPNRAPITRAERAFLVQAGKAFAATIADASYFVKDLEAWIERAENDIEDAQARTRRPETRAFALRELIYKPVLAERLREISRQREADGRTLNPRPEGDPR